MVFFITMHSEVGKHLQPHSKLEDPERSNYFLMLDEVTQQWLHRKSEETQRAYKRDVRRLLKIANKPLNEITPEDLYRFRESLRQMAPSTQRRSLTAVNSLLKHRNSLGHRLCHTVQVFAVPAVKTRPKQSLSRADIHRLFAGESDPRNHLLLRVLYEAAPRVAAIQQFRWRDLRTSGTGGYMVVPSLKSKDTREMPLTADTWQALIQFKQEAQSTDPVFRSQKGGPLTSSQVFRIVQAAGQRLGFPHVSPLGLRHAHIAHALEGGAPLHVIQRCLGYALSTSLHAYLPTKSETSSSDTSTLHFLTR
jgi:integrase/recombinase XerD